MEAPQRLHRPNVGGCGRRIARYDEPVPDECLPAEVHDDDDQIQHSADSCVSLWRCFNVNICHFGSLENLTSTSRNGLTKRIASRVLKFYWRPLAEPLDFSCCIP